MFLISKIQKKIVFFLYSQKQVFENRKQKLLPNITLTSFIVKSLKLSVVTHFMIINGVPCAYRIVRHKACS